MTGFLIFLDPNTIYLSFRYNDEQKAMIKEKTRMAALNIQITTKYVICKLLSIGVLAAISELSSSHAPLVLFLSDLPDFFCVYNNKGLCRHNEWTDQWHNTN